MGHDIGGLHHVGHLVHDMGQALERYRRLGFALPDPAYPVLGEPPEPFGVGNTHAYLADGFIELVSVAGASGRVPDDVRLIPLHAPAERLPALKAAVSRAAANLDDCLRRFEGVHILMFDSANIDAAAARLTESGVGHGGVLDTQRPVETEDELRMEPARLLEIDGVEVGRVPEGRVGAGLQRHRLQRRASQRGGRAGRVRAVRRRRRPGRRRAALRALPRPYGGPGRAERARTDVPARWGREGHAGRRVGAGWAASR
ncbi:VOC family protein [Nonomuraea purpurea]